MHQGSSAHSPEREVAHPIAIRQSTALATAIAPHPDLDDSLNLRDILRTLLKRKWWIISVATVVLGGGMLFTLLQTPIYRATTTIQIDRSAARVVDYNKEGTLNSGGGYYEDPREFLATQYELLKSKTLAARVMESMQLDLERAKRPDSGTRPKDSPVRDDAAEEGSGLLARITNTIRKRREPSIQDERQLDREAVIGALSASTTIEPVRNSRLVKINADNADPSQAARIANAWAQAFIASNLDRRVEASSYAKTFLEQQLASTKARLEDSEAQLNRYAREKEIVNVDDKTNLVAQNLQEFMAALAKAEQERIKSEANYSEVKRNLATSRDVLESKSMAPLREAKAKLETEYQEQLKVYKPGFPKMQQLQAQIDELDRKLVRERGIVSESIEGGAKASLDAARTQETQLRARVETAKRAVLQLQDQSIRYNILKREVDTNREIYNGLLQRMKEVGVAAGVGTNNVSVVERAETPLFPFKPDLVRNAALALFLGLMLGVGLAFLIEHFDDSIRFPDEIERFTGASLMGVIPKTSDRAGATPAEEILKDPRAAIAEAYRSLRTALQFSTAQGAPRTLVVTSCAKGEGKSTTAFATAVAIAQLGKRVLLIDADMRNPSLHKTLGLSSEPGLSNILSSDTDPISVTHRTPIAGLYAIFAGPPPPNPVELLAGARLHELLSEDRTSFDHIIIDSPPVLGIADAVVLSQCASATLFVVEAGKTRKASIRAALKRLQITGIHPLGIVLTKLPNDTPLYGYDTSLYYYGAENANLKQEHG